MEVSVIIFVIIIIIWLLFLSFYNKKERNDEYTDDEYDTLMHLSTETMTLDGVLSILQFYDPTYASFNQIDKKGYQNTGIKYTIKCNVVPVESASNYTDQLCNRYWESLYENNLVNYAGVKRLSAIPHETKYYTGTHGNFFIVTEYTRLSDDMKFYYVQASQNFGGYNNLNSYKVIDGLCRDLKKYYPNGEFIIVGDFNVHYHEAITEMHFGDTHHILKFHDIGSCDDNEGLAGPDGVVVSKKLYPRVEYSLDLAPIQNYQHFVVNVKLYSKGRVSLERKITKEYKAYIEHRKGYRGDLDYTTAKKPVFPDGTFNDSFAAKETNLTKMEIGVILNTAMETSQKDITSLQTSVKELSDKVDKLTPSTDK